MKPTLKTPRWMPGLAAAFLLLAAGCAIHPAGEDEERERASQAGKAYEERQPPPPLAENPAADDYLQHAFLASADLEARYWEWRAALEQIPQDSSLQSAAISFDYMFSGGSMKAWDRTTLGISNDPMANIPFPTKLATAGRRALEAARAAGLRFEAAKFLLQGKVLSTYCDLALLAESIRTQEENIALVEQVLAQVAARVQAGMSPQEDLLRARTDLDLARNSLESLRSRVPGLAARMNALVGRPAGAPVPLPRALPPPRPLPASDETLLGLAAERSPELAALARQVAGGEEALSLAKQQYIPDFGLSFSFTGSISQTVGGMLVIPLRIEAIEAAIAQARAGIRAAQAAMAQYERDLAASFILNLQVLRDHERQAALFEGQVLPRMRETLRLLQTAHAAGRGAYVDLLEAQRTLLDARLTVAQLRMEREKALAAIETWAAVDVEVMGAPAGGSMPGSTRPAFWRVAAGPTSVGATVPEERR